ncbi:hypothetical protein DEU34_1630 [Microbacterium sp. AG1240]|uniref:hypothetical protein n=1 Tax=Microbacterium sp. AG1240 TaxID=2183992 RepID=UPI000F2D69D7|nr:hypothetical protein [Microbacterium sp. AG1240]RKT37091.1 hypothetical protein DEU34_1630 [Microbacterium sp. AG1240]
MNALPPVPAPRSTRLPFPSWPVWAAFGLLLIPSIVMLGIFGLAKDAASDRLALERDVVGRTVVATGTLGDVDTTSGMPKTSSFYDVTIPDGGGTVTFSGDEQWGFPPSSDYPAELDFLVVLDDRPRAVQHGAVGSLAPVTEQTVRATEGSVAAAFATWVVGIVVFWIFALGMPVLGTLLAVRRRRARRRLAA